MVENFQRQNDIDIAVLKRDVGEIKQEIEGINKSLNNLHETINMGKGAWQVFMTLGGWLAAVIAIVAYVVEHSKDWFK